MKKLFLVLSFVALVFASCGSKSAETIETSVDSTIVTVDTVQVATPVSVDTLTIVE